MARQLTFGSLFAGIGGFDLGFERAGMKCVWQVEIDPFCRKLLAKHWPDVRRWDDVRTFPPEPTEDWTCDVICGGFPCQDISNAHTNGRRRGIGGERSGLWVEFFRVFRVVRPRWVVVENSPAWQRWTAAVCEDLHGLGYCPTPLELEAAAVGAPHARPRVFVVAHANGNSESPCPFDEEAPGLPPPASLGRHWRGTLPGPVGVADGVSSEVVLRAYGNAVVPQVAEWIGRRIVEVVEPTL